MALLAWTLLATNAMAGPLRMLDAMPMTASQAPVAHCDGMPMQPGIRHHGPATPMGHGDCCHGGCHCLLTCNVMLAVPRLTVLVPLPHPAAPGVVPVGARQEPATPPLRPPIA